MVKTTHFFLFFSAMALFSACNTEKKCPYKPVPIFEKGLPHVLQYNFERKGTQSLESMMLDTGVLLEIGQDVCEISKQEYRFIVKGDRRNFADSLWLREASRQLVFLSSFSEKQAALKAWGDIIEERRMDMRLGQDREVQPGMYVRVDKVSSPEESTLIVLFTQN
jgi:hypothetical protein